MTVGPTGVPAAPNRSLITARVLDVQRSEQFSDKWNLSLEILDSKDVEGPNFAHPGEQVRAFTFGPMLEIESGDTIEAAAEFVGDERGGRFRLAEVDRRR